MPIRTLMGTVAETQAGRERRATRRGPMRPRRLVGVRANQSRRLSSHVFRAVDLLALAATTIAVMAQRSPTPLLEASLGSLLPLTAAAVVLIRLLRALQSYRLPRSESLPTHLLRVVAAVALTLPVALLVGWLAGTTDTATGFLPWAAGCAVTLTVLHLGWWSTVRVWRSRGWLTPNIVVVGATEYAQRVIAEALARSDVNVLAVFDDRVERSPQSLLGVPVLGNIDALLAHKITPYLDRIVIAVEPSAASRLREIAHRLAILPNEVSFFLDPGNEPERSAEFARIEDAPLAALGRPPSVDSRAVAKRVQDLLIGGPILVLISPLLAMIALLIKLDSRGPVFFRQRRHGFNNEEIVVWKFRSMHADASDARADRQVTAGDDRVTRVGRLLRKSSLDELPQLLNVVRGEMSLVGPRPHAIGMKTGEVESAELVAEYAHRHRIKPGMTGWAAVNGSRGPMHAAAEVERRVAFDVDYIARQSLQLDLRIMARTLPSLLGDRQAIR